MSRIKKAANVIEKSMNIIFTFCGFLAAFFVILITGFLFTSGMPAIGEIGLTGELRAVNQMDRRLAEVLKLGFKACIIPQANVKNLRVPEGLRVLPAKTLTDALGFIL